MHRSMWLVGAVLAVTVASPASATFPGENGALVFSVVEPANPPFFPTEQIYRIEPAGGVATPLTSPAPSGQVWNECPSWSADGRLIYFDSQDRAGAEGAAIFRMNATGGDRTLVASADAANLFCPSVNWKGTLLTAQYDGDDTEGIVLMNADGSGQRIVAAAGANQDLFTPRFAPRGSRILFNQVAFGPGGQGIANADLLIVNPNGATRVVTRRSNDLFFFPSWSPRGDLILAVRGAAQDEIVQLNVGGNRVRSLVKVPGASLQSPTFSPDGSKIAYFQCIGQDVDCGPEGAGTGTLWVMDADGSNRTLVLDGATAGIEPAGTVDWGVRTP